MLSSFVEAMARRFLPGPNAAYLLSWFLFFFMFLPTLVMLSSVVVLVVMYYPRLRKTPYTK